MVINGEKILICWIPGLGLLYPAQTHTRDNQVSTNRPYKQAVQAGSTIRQYKQAVQTGSTSRQYKQPVQAGSTNSSTSRQYKKAVQAGSTSRQ